MIEYKNELRIRVHARKGTVEMPDLNSTAGYESQLDKEIIACASKCVKGQKLVAFFLAYHCVNTWEDIQMHFLKHLRSELNVESVQRYARDAASRITDRITQA